MCKQHDTKLRESLPEVEPAVSVRLLTWFFSSIDSPVAAPTCSIVEVLASAIKLRVEAFADYTTSGPKSSHAPLSMASPVLTSSLALWACTPPPLALPMSYIKASGTQVRFSSLMLVISTKPKKRDCSSDSVSNDQPDMRACIGIKKESINDGGHGSNVNARSAPQVTRCDTTPIEGGGE